MLLIPKSFIETYLNDLDNEDRLEIMSAIFYWYIGYEPIKFESKIAKILFNNLLPILEGHKSNYENGSKGGAPKGNLNAKKTTKTTTKTTKTTPLVLENNPKEKEKEKEKEKDKDIDKDTDIDTDIDTDTDIDIDTDTDTDTDIDTENNTDKLIEIMKPVIEEGLIKEEEIRNWGLKDTRAKLNYIYKDYTNWEKDLMDNGITIFKNIIQKKYKNEFDVIQQSLIDAHWLLYR